jgi:hypothetical protein
MDYKAQHLPAKVHFVNQNEKFMLWNRKLLNSPHASRTGADQGSESKFLHNFDPNKQTWKLFLEQIPHVILTFLFLIAHVATVLIYQAKQPVDCAQKTIFNIVTTVIMLGLGLNFFEVFKDMARIARWRILSSHYFEVREVDLILGAESLMNVFQLMTQSYRKLPVFLVCLVWLLINIGAQIPVAILPLSASLERGYNSSGTTISQDYVSVPKLNCFYRSGMKECDVNQDRVDPAVAHTYGEQGTFRGQNCSYHSTDDINNGPQSCPYFTRNDRREFAVRFADSNPNDVTNTYPYYGTKRIITIAATDCNEYLASTDPDKSDSSDGIETEFVWRFENSTGTYSLSIPRSSLAANSTTYIWNGTDLPTSETLQACGPRCVFLYALRDMFISSNHQISIFQCHITVSPVSNTKNPAHVLSDSMARTAAASIALTGRWRGRDNFLDWRQFQLYQDGAEWAARLHESPEDIGARMAEFAAATLATMAQRNPITRIPGSLPTLGYQTDVEWDNIGPLIASIATVHLLLVCLILWVARPVVVVDDSYLVIARLLQGIVETGPDENEMRLSQRTELARELASAIRAKARAGAGAGSGERVEKAEESRPLLKESPLSSAGNLNDAGAMLGDDARGTEQRQKSSKHATENNASDIGDLGLPERTVHDMT